MKKNLFLALMSGLLFLSGCAQTFTLVDPESGSWNYQKKSHGDFVDVDLKYVARNGASVDGFYATTGFVDGMAIVAKCTFMKNKDGCGEWDYYMINPNAEVIADFSAYTLPTLVLCQGEHASVFLRDKRRDNSVDFRMWDMKSDTCAEKYTSKNPFNGNLILVYDVNADRYGFFNFKGKMVIPAVYKAATSFYDNGFAYVVNDDNVYGTLDYSGNFVPQTYACKDKPLSNGLVYVNTTGKIYDYNADSRVGDGTFYISNDLERSSKTDLENCMSDAKSWKILDKDNNLIVPAGFSGTKISTDTNLIRTRMDDLYGYYDSTGALLYDAKYKNIIPGSKIFALQNTNNKWAIGTNYGSIKTDFKYDDVNYFYKSTDLGNYITTRYVIVTIGKKKGLVNDDGVMIVPVEYSRFVYVNPDLIISQGKDEKYGVIYNGIEVYKPIYDAIGEFVDGKALARFDGREVYLFLTKEDEIKFMQSMPHRPPRPERM